METVGIICEYNPLHRGHFKQLCLLKDMGATGIVCLMSGNYVQRGEPAIFDKSLRARAAVECGADLVLELPLTVALQSAEGFAAGGVSILGGFCSHLCFGAENNDPEALLGTARVLLSEEFPPALRTQLDTGKSFPAARAAALESLGCSPELLRSPNNILAVEYCKAILSQGCCMEPLPIYRGGSYHDREPDRENPSATAVRQLVRNGENWQELLPEAAGRLFAGGTVHTLAAGERAVLARLKTMTEDEFAALPFGSEGLWRKLMHAAHREGTLEAVATAVKSKRYTRSRIDRMILCAFLGLTEAMLREQPPYTKVLAFNDRGRDILRQARRTGSFPNEGTPLRHSYACPEARAEALYGLFAQDAPEAPKKQRVQYIP